MSKLLSAGDYRREIGELDAFISMEEQLSEQLGPDPAAEVTLHSLRARRDALSAQLAELGDEALPRHELEVVVDGRPVHQHAVELPFLSAFLQKLQNLAQAVRASSVGINTRAGPHSKRLQKSGTLRLSAAFAGSFGMRLETPIQELPLDDAGSPAHTFNTLLNLLDGEAEGDFLERLAPLGPRARAHYKALLHHVENSGASVRMRWQGTDKIREAGLRPGQAGRLVQQLERTRTTEQVRTVPGVLDGAVRSKGLFAFIADTGDRYEGTVDPSAIEDLRTFYSEPCLALITTRTVLDLTTGDMRPFHRLERLTAKPETNSGTPSPEFDNG